MRAAAWSLALLTVAGLTLLIPAAPDYDAWAYLTWGREVAHFELSTEDGPAFKPLPVIVCALLSSLGSAAPEAWLVVVRAGALAAVVLAGWLVHATLRRPRAAGDGTAAGSGFGVPRATAVAAGVAAAVGVLLTGGFVRYAAGGDAEPVLVALALGAWQRHRAGRVDQALLLAALAALVRVETWPFVAAYAVATVGWRRATALGAAVAALWFLPELAGSGDLLRSGERASVPNPGAPAEADVPFLASLEGAAALLPLPLAAAALIAPPAARMPILAGVAWCVLVALMAEVGFSGEARYAMPGVALIAVGAAAGLARAGELLRGRSSGRDLDVIGGRSSGRDARAVRAPLSHRAGAVIAAVVVLTLAVSRNDFDGLRANLAYRERLVDDLERVIGAAGGRDALLACGRPAVGRYRGTMTAYALDVPKQQVRADGLPDAVTLRSRLGRRDPLQPQALQGGRLLAANEHWRVEARCVSGDR